MDTTDYSVPDMLDCGHANMHRLEERARGVYSGGTGYGMDAEGKRHCYACCADRERARMIETGRATLYLVQRKRPSTVTEWRVTDWAGHLEFRVRECRVHPNAGGFGAGRRDAWFTGPDGYIWHAVNRGDSQTARCKRTKERA